LRVQLFEKRQAEVAPESLLQFYRGIARSGMARLISQLELPKTGAANQGLRRVILAARQKAASVLPTESR
jgi:hypothetical protein